MSIWLHTEFQYALEQADSLLKQSMALEIDWVEEGFELEGDVQKRTRKNLAARDILSQILLH